MHAKGRGRLRDPAENAGLAARELVDGDRGEDGHHRSWVAQDANALVDDERVVLPGSHDDDVACLGRVDGGLDVEELTSADRVDDVGGLR